MSPNALRNFVAGAVPRRTTRVRLEEWLSTRPAVAHTPTIGRLVKAVDALTPDLPAGEAAHFGREMSRLLFDAYQRRRIPPPRWVRELARHYGSDQT